MEQLINSHSLIYWDCFNIVNVSSYFLRIFIVFFVILGVGYSTLTPIFENSDETLHYPYIKHLADGLGLPLAIPNQLWKQEGTQPPLYYAIVAASTFWIDSDNLSEHLQYNPHWLFTEVRVLINDNQNRVLHGPMDDFPYRRAALAIHIGRWWSLIFGLLTVSGTFLLGQYLFPNNLPLTLTATALTAFNPQFLRVSATVSNDSLSAFLTTLAVLLTLKLTEHGLEKKSLSPVLLGILCGLATMTKLSSSTTIVLVSFIIIWRGLEFSSRKAKFDRLSGIMFWLGIIGLTTFFFTGWWFYRNYLLYGEWLAAETHLNLAGRSNLSLGEIWQQRAEIQRAYWATFGWGQIRLPEWIYQLLAWFITIGFSGTIMALANTRNKEGDRFKSILLIFWVMLNLSSYLGWVMKVGSVSHTRLIFPSMAAISLLIAWGWHSLLSYIFLPKNQIWFCGLVSGLLLALNFYTLGGLIYPAFTPSNQPLSSTEIFMPLNLTFLNKLKLVDGNVNSSSQPTLSKAQARPGEVIFINAHWQTVASLDKNYSVSAVLLSPDNRVLAHRETFPSLGLRPTRYLNVGDIFFDTYPLRLDTEITEPMLARATLNLFEVDSATRNGFSAIDSSGHEITPIVGYLKITPKEWPIYQPTHSSQVNFADSIVLIGYDLSWGNQQQSLELVFYWQSLRSVESDYVVFVHLLDEQGKIIGGADSPPNHNAYPTRWWSPGETIADRRQLSLPANVSKIHFGLYDLISGQRLGIITSTLDFQDNSIELPIPYP